MKSNEWVGPLLFIAIAGAAAWFFLRQRSSVAGANAAGASGSNTDAAQAIGGTVAGAACSRLGLGSTVAADCAWAGSKTVAIGGKLAPSTLGISQTAGEVGTLAATVPTLSTEGTVKGAQYADNLLAEAPTWARVASAPVYYPTRAVTYTVGTVTPYVGNKIESGAKAVWNWL